MPITTTSLHFHPEVPVFDAQICVGSGRSALGPVRSRDALLAELDKHGVGRAMIYHGHCDEFSVIQGNRLLEEWLADDGRLLPLWSAFPIPESLAQLQELHSAKRVQAVRLIGNEKLPFSDWAHGDLLAWLEAERLPLWMALPDFHAAEIVTTLRAFPRLQVVLVGAHYSDTVVVRKMLAALPNVSLELSRYESLGAISDLVAQVGAERLLYGSWYPRYAIGAMLYALHHYGFDRATLAAICAGNLERLLGQVSAQ